MPETEQKQPKHKPGNKGQRGGAQPGAGRPSVKFTEEQLEKFIQMAKQQCHVKTIADSIGIDEETVRRNKELSVLLKQKRAEGRAELHEMQWNMRKQPVMAIWLGKQHLEQSDKAETKLNAGDTPLVVVIGRETSEIKLKTGESDVQIKQTTGNQADLHG